MRILIDIGHPAHVHLFMPMAKELEKKGHKIFFSCREIPVAQRLLEANNYSFLNLGKKSDSLIGKAFRVLWQDLQLFSFVIRKRINIGICNGICLPHISKVSFMNSIVCDDDDDEGEILEAKFGNPFADSILTPKWVSRKGKNALFYSGTHELAYLHPNRFMPNKNVLKKAGIKDGEIFFIMRFVAFKAHHDVGQAGLSISNKESLVNLLSRYGRVIITSERKLEDEFEQYRLPVPPEDIHSLMYYASLYVGDSQTMTSEAGLLGVPALKCNTFAGRASVPNMYENYGLTYAYQPEDFDKMYHHIENILANPNAKEEWIKKRDKFLEDMIDPTKFFVWYVENYPESKKIMKTNPDYQYNFR